MRRVMSGHCAVLIVLLCLQATASMLALRRDSEDRLRAAAVSGLVWASLRRLDRPKDTRRPLSADSR